MTVYGYGISFANQAAGGFKKFLYPFLGREGDFWEDI